MPMNLFMSIKETMTRELVPMDEPKAQRHLRRIMFAMAAVFTGLGAWKIPAMDLDPSSRVLGWMTLAVVTTQCIVSGLLSGRYQLKKGFRINGQVIWMLVGAMIFVVTILGLGRVEGITPAQLRLGCLLAVMMQLNCFMAGLLWPITKKSGE